MAMDNRPLSPHIQVYRWQITMAMSILHRITGVGLGLGALLLTWWLAAAAAGPDYFTTVHGIMTSVIGRVIMFGFTAALFFHLCNGVRHLFWDAGIGLEIDSARNSSYAVLVLAAAATVLVFVIGYAVR
jgi:succinate dehydrogenase / fumarate reductase cytochrome b subunit